jgi:hypothetical protein
MDLGLAPQVVNLDVGEYVPFYWYDMLGHTGLLDRIPTGNERAATYWLHNWFDCGPSWAAYTDPPHPSLAILTRPVRDRRRIMWLRKLLYNLIGRPIDLDRKVLFRGVFEPLLDPTCWLFRRVQYDRRMPFTYPEWGDADGRMFLLLVDDVPMTGKSVPYLKGMGTFVAAPDCPMMAEAELRVQQARVLFKAYGLLVWPPARDTEDHLFRGMAASLLDASMPDEIKIHNAGAYRDVRPPPPDLSAVMGPKWAGNDTSTRTDAVVRAKFIKHFPPVGRDWLVWPDIQQAFGTKRQEIP